MSRRSWLAALLLIFAINLWGLWTASGRDEVSSDLDTKAIFSGIQSRSAPLSWFATDWPLENGFYRPITVLTFEADLRIYGDEIPKVRITNWWIATLCSLLAVWFVWELTRKAGYAIGVGTLVAGWQTNLFADLELNWLFAAAAVATAATSLFVHKSSRLQRLALAGLLVFLASETVFHLAESEINSRTLAWRVIGWPPGRTASVMAVFALISLASYCRLERTKLIGWAFVSWISLLCALFSYEQAVVLFGCLLGCSLALHLQGVQVRWLFHLIPIAATATYVVLHSTLLPADSSYRLQQARSVSGGVRDLLNWLVPGLEDARKFYAHLDPTIGMGALFLTTFWSSAVGVAANACAYLAAARPGSLWLWFGLIGSVGTYGSLAFQHPFAHYYYLPAVFRAIFVVGLVCTWWSIAFGSWSNTQSKTTESCHRDP